MERRLTAIFAADVAGYSRLIGADEEGTLTRLTAHRRELIEPKIAEHQGRLVKTTGDGVLAEFASPVKAVRWAIDVQHGMVARNADIPEGQHIVGDDSSISVDGSGTVRYIHAGYHDGEADVIAKELIRREFP